MKKINFNQPKYILPVIALPFLCLIFYVFSSWGKNKKQSKDEIARIKQKTDQINPAIQDPSKEVKAKSMKDKFEAYTDRFSRQSDYSAVQSVESNDPTSQGSSKSLYSNLEKDRIDSITNDIKKRQLAESRLRRQGSGSYTSSSEERAGKNSAISETDKRMAAAMTELNHRRTAAGSQGGSGGQEDEYAKQMKVFKQQMNYMDSIQQSHDPNYKPLKKRKLSPTDTVTVKPLHVTKTDNVNAQVFNTIKAKQTDLFIKAIMDENLKGYAGSRIRIRLLDDIQVGQELLAKGTYLFGLIHGFQLQRVLIKINSIMVGDKILPVNLEIYDNDGLEGLYVPGSQFREFTKQLGASSTQGIQYNDDGSGSNAIMTGLVSKMFSSTTTAASQLIRKDKAKLKYNTIVYLVSKDKEE